MTVTAIVLFLIALVFWFGVLELCCRLLDRRERARTDVMRRDRRRL